MFCFHIWPQDSAIIPKSNMAPFTTADRVHFVKTVIKCDGSLAAALRKIRAECGRSAAPSRQALQQLIKKFEETGSVGDRARPPRPFSVRTAETIAAVQHSVAVSPTTSSRRRSLELGVARTTLRRILRQDCVMWPYKVQLTQELKDTDHTARRAFAKCMIDEINRDPQFFNKIIFSDEAHFHLNGYVNKQNCRIWATENPRVTHEVSLHPKRVTVWCALWAGGVMGPFFFEDAEDESALTVNGERYRDMLVSFFWPLLEEMDLTEMWFQQDGAPCHTTIATVALLHQKFPGRVISRRGDMEWPPRSCDLSPLDFFLWGYIKDKVYANKPRTILALKTGIRDVIGEIGPAMCQKVMQNYGDRINYCQQSRGGHLADIIFHV